MKYVIHTIIKGTKKITYLALKTDPEKIDWSKGNI